jgi:hypothetical protein
LPHRQRPVFIVADGENSVHRSEEMAWLRRVPLVTVDIGCVLDVVSLLLEESDHAVFPSPRGAVTGSRQVRQEFAGTDAVLGRYVRRAIDVVV